MVILVVALSAVSLLLFFKLWILKSGLKELKEEYVRIENDHTNTLIGISSLDADLCALADTLNKTHNKVQEKYHQYAQGDMEMKNTITGVTHDLRTPLTAICGYIDLLKNDELSLEERKKYLEIIENRAAFMKELTEELFEFSKALCKEQEELPLEEVFLNQMMEDVLMEYYGVLSKASIEPVVEITEKRIIRKLNPHALERILSNMISNSIKYSRGDLRISLDANGIISFSNFAPEMSQLDVNRLFDRYYTVQTGRASTGLGLSIVKSFVKRMDGNIEAEYKNDYLTIRIWF